MGVATLGYIRKRYVNDAYVPEVEQVPIAICTPMYNSTPFLEKYLNHVLLYDYPKDLLSLYFTVQGKDGTYDGLKQFEKEYGDEYRKIKIKKVKQSTGGELPHVRNVVTCRKLLTKWSKPDLVFFNDHDNFNPPVSIKRLQQGLALGASAAAGVYVFFQRSQGEKKGSVGFTSFFLEDGKMYHFALQNVNHGHLPLEMFGRRIWVDCISCGCLLIKRELLDEVDWFVPYGTAMTDDTAYFLKARSLGHRIIADFGLVVEHWGYNIAKRRMLEIHVTSTQDMFDRRTKMREDGVYTHPGLDMNMNEAVRKFVDIDKIS